MRSEMFQQPKRIQYKVAIDFLSGVSCFYALIGSFIIGHYFPESRDTHGNITIQVKILLLNIPLAFASMLWLIIRFNGLLTQISEKYPSTKTQWFKVLFILGIPMLYLLGYSILKHTLWR